MQNTFSKTDECNQLLIQAGEKFLNEKHGVTGSIWCEIVYK